MFVERLCRSVLTVAGFCMFVSVSGCGTATADVSGTIKIDGKVPNQTGIEIVFLAPNGRLFTAPVHEDGTYRAIAVPAGVMKVGFNYLAPLANEGTGKRSSRLPSRTGEPPKMPAKEPVKNPIPEPLREASTSGLTFKVQAGTQNVFNYDVQP
jgi:hypothetical protein